MTYTVTLADGTAYTLTSRKPIKAWKSALMQRAPYATVWTGAVFTRS